MYAMSEDRARPPGPGRAEHELPVLFHLMDVSRTRQAPPEASPQAIDTSPTPETQIATPTASVDLSPIATESLLNAATPAASSIGVPPPISVDYSFETPAATHATPISDALLESVSAEASQSSVVSVSIPAPSEAISSEVVSENHARPTEAPKNQLVTRRNHKTAASEDWFATHGKYIAIGFVLALIGTIWMARNNRQQSNSASAGSPWNSPLAEDRSSGPHSSPAITMPAAGSTHSTVLVSADSQVELHPPTTSQLATGATGDGKSQGKDKLFDFPSPKTADERVAKRPDAGNIDASTSSQKNTPAHSAAGPAPPVIPTPGGAPALSPAYPTTSPSAPPPSYPAAVSPTSSYPQTAAPPLVGANVPIASPAPQAAGYPSAPYGSSGAPSNYRSQFPVPAGAAAPQASAWTASPNGAIPPGHYQPLDNTALGPRNERTGSGNY